MTRLKAIGPKIMINKVAEEIISAGKLDVFVPAGSCMGVDSALRSLDALLRKDRIALTDRDFRERYGAFIRNYGN